MEDLSEKEQIDQMRAWWSEYGNYVIGGIIVGIAIIVGLTQFRSQQVESQTEASALYETVFEAIADGKVEDAETAAQELFADYGKTVYPSQARLALARLYMDKGRDQDAADSLNAVLESDAKSQYAPIARLRVAKVYLYQNKPDEVVELLSGLEEGAYTSRYSEALGDAYVMNEAWDDAREAYLRAMADNATNPTVDRVLLQMKVDDLPEVVEAVAETSAESVDADAAVGAVVDDLEEMIDDVAAEAEEAEDAMTDGEEDVE